MIEILESMQMKNLSKDMLCTSCYVLIQQRSPTQSSSDATDQPRMDTHVYGCNSKINGTITTYSSCLQTSLLEMDTLWVDQR